MKLKHKLDPLLEISKPGDNILTYGCYKLSLHFMVEPIGVVSAEEFQALMPKLAEACCKVIDEHNKAEDEKIENVPNGL